MRLLGIVYFLIIIICRLVLEAPAFWALSAGMVAFGSAFFGLWWAVSIFLDDSPRTLSTEGRLVSARAVLKQLFFSAGPYKFLGLVCLKFLLPGLIVARGVLTAPDVAWLIGVGMAQGLIVVTLVFFLSDEKST